MSQPALSAALRRLRRHFGDELLVRVGNTHELTPLAVFLSSRVSAALDGVERVFDAKPEFDPAQCRRKFTVFASDYALAVAGPHLVAALAARAPHARLRFRQPSLSQVGDVAPDLRAADALIFPLGFFGDLPFLEVFRDRWVCIVDNGNSQVDQTLSVEQLIKLPWVAALNGPRAAVPALRQLELRGVPLEIHVVTDGFLAVPAMVAGSERVALIQERLARTMHPELGIRVLECPFEVPPLIEAMWWHPSSDHDPEHELLRTVFADVAATLAAPV